MTVQNAALFYFIVMFLPETDVPLIFFFTTPTMDLFQVSFGNLW